MRKSVILTVVGVVVAGTAVIHALAGGQPMWATPSVMAVKRVSDVSAVQNRPYFLSNLDCTALTYRLVGQKTMQKGCFTRTAFGMLDSEHALAIFNGTDEALPLLSSSPHQVLVPWPEAPNLITLDAADTGGSYINMYKNPLADMHDERDQTGQLTGKRLTAPPNIHLKGADGKPLVVNAQTLSFSRGGSWLVAETLNGSFVRINLASLDQLPFARSFAAPGWPGTLFKSQVAVSEDGRYVAIGNDMDSSLKVYDLNNCRGICPAYDYLPFLKREIPGLQKIRQIRFLNEGLLSFEAVTGSSHDGLYELAPASSITSLSDYLGLGDSYTSGEGAFDYLAGTDTANNTCHLSANSYPLLLSHDLFGSASGHSVACSGAIISDISSTGGDYRGQVRRGNSFNELRDSEALGAIMANFSPGYVAQRRFADLYQPRVITVSIGGNDIGFGDILTRCVSPHLSRHLSDNTCYNTYESRRELTNLIDRTIPHWTHMYQQLRSESPGSTVYAVGYPSIASDTGRCTLNVRLDKSELEFAEELIQYLDAAMRTAVVAANVSYVDVSHALAGHRLCEASGNSVAVNGLTAGNDFGIFGIGLLGRESYHPNILGQRLIEQAILNGTDNLSGKQKPKPVIAPDTTKLLDSPVTGRPINSLVQDRLTDSQQVWAGQTLHIRINGARDGLRPSSPYVVRLDGPTGPILGNLHSEPSANISGPVMLPDGTTPDIHMIDVIGPGQDDNPVDVTQPIYVLPDSHTAYGNPSVTDTYTGSGNPVDPASTTKDNDVFRTGQASGVLGDSRRHSASTSKERYPKTGRPGFQSSSSRVLSQFIVIIVASVVFSVLLFYTRRNIKFLNIYFGRHLNNWPKKSYGNHASCFTIVIMRRFGAIVLCLVLFISLLTLALSTASNSVLGSPKKIDSWLNQSGLYGSFAGIAIEQADKTAGNDQSGGVSLSNATVKQAAEAAFSSQLIHNNVSLFLNANYAWLEGKTAKPQFKIDLTDAKAAFAQRVGKYVKTYLSTLPACTPAQEAKLDVSTVDPLTLNCRPSKLDPATEGKLVTRQLSSSSDFLSEPIITPETFDSKDSEGEAAPYYEQAAGAPRAYQFSKKIPWIAGVLAILSAVAIYFLAPKRRKAVKLIGITLAVTGVVLVLVKLVADQLFRSLEQRVFDQTDIGQLQKSLTNFLHIVEGHIVKIDLWFGLGYLALAAILLSGLILTRQRGLRIPKPLQSLMPSDESTEQGPDTPVTSKPESKPDSKPRRPKPPRLIQ